MHPSAEFDRFPSFVYGQYGSLKETKTSRFRKFDGVLPLTPEGLLPVRLRVMSTSGVIPIAPPASDEATRKSMMSNRRTDTKPEIAFRSMLHRSGLRFRKDRYVKFETRGVKVDVVFPTQRVAVFIDGCFWHRCPEHGTMPTRNYEYWLAKFRRNMDRDAANNENLRRIGWRVLRVWEHEVKDIELAQFAVDRVKTAVQLVSGSESVKAESPKI